MEFQVWKLANSGFSNRRRLWCAQLAAIALLWLPIPACVNTAAVVLDPANPSGAALATFNGHFTAVPAALDPTGTSSPVLLEQFSQFWIAAGDPITAVWDDYSLGLRCQKQDADPASQPLFAFNLCQPDHDCADAGQPNPVCEVNPPSSVGSQSCAHDRRIFLASQQVFSVPDDPEVHFVGNGSALNVWLLQHTCMKGTCSMSAPTGTTSFLWAAGCKDPAQPTFGVSYTPVVDASMGGDASLQLWASRRPDFAQNPAPLPPDTDNDDQPGPALKVSAVGTMPRRDSNRQHFILSCGPAPPSGPAPPACFTQDDDTESQWITYEGDAPTTEGFSSRLRVREIRVFASETDANPMPPLAFCSAFINGQRNTEARSDCDATGGMQSQDCRAVPTAPTVNFSPRDRWKITFSDKSVNGNASPCPNDFSRSEIWVEFTLEKKL